MEKPPTSVTQYIEHDPDRLQESLVHILTEEALSMAVSREPVTNSPHAFFYNFSKGGVLIASLVPDGRRPYHNVIGGSPNATLDIDGTLHYAGFGDNTEEMKKIMGALKHLGPTYEDRLIALVCER